MALDITRRSLYIRDDEKHDTTIRSVKYNWSSTTSAQNSHQTGIKKSSKQLTIPLKRDMVVFAVNETENAPHNH